MEQWRNATPQESRGSRSDSSSSALRSRPRGNLLAKEFENVSETAQRLCPPPAKSGTPRKDIESPAYFGIAKIKKPPRLNGIFLPL
jgi:hypothetical protein